MGRMRADKLKLDYDKTKTLLVKLNWTLESKVAFQMLGGAAFAVKAHSDSLGFSLDPALLLDV